MEQLIVAWLMQRGREASELALTHILRWWESTEKVGHVSPNTLLLIFYFFVCLFLVFVVRRFVRLCVAFIFMYFHKNTYNVYFS
jgi:small-conductance mechanosensitive channel